jgi:hypothetical protein
MVPLCGHVAIDEMRGFALVEFAPASLLEAGDGRRKLLFYELALLQRTIGTVQENFRAVRELLHHRRLQREHKFHSLRGGETILGQPVGGFERDSPRQLAESRVGERHSGHRALTAEAL